MQHYYRREKIALVTYALNQGGISTFITDLASIFERRNYDVDIITTEKKGDYYNILKKKFKSLFYIYYGIFRWIPLGRIIHSIITGFVLKKKKYGIIFLIHSYAAHSSIFLYCKKARIFSIIQNAEKNVVKLGCSNNYGLNAIVCVSNRVLENAKKILKDGNCILIENSVPIPDNSLFAKRLSFENTMKILYVGRMDNEQKGIFCLPDILKKCLEKGYDMQLTLAGDGKDMTELKNRFDKYGLGGVIKFLGAVPRSNIAQLYASHHVLIMPSKFEGLPFVLMEAMSWGCVPVVSFLKGITDYCVDDGENGFLVEVGNIQQYTETIGKIYTEKELWKKLSFSAREKAIKSFSIEKMAGKYMNLITTFQHRRSLNFFHFLKFFELYSIKEIVPNGIIMRLKEFIHR